ncbi:hypothetical protein [Nocardioides sp. GY 10127]|uniref:hypothetical protein n=1 Tax=Nocardioides sp. GY 10127 TaxID=2569762 RepID=UPI0010A8AE8E|nr:hypothetical protein [Nocardioides sp. GY 10127]TIC79368.1 hypothetical protein E8D37_17405 [Nocardioides sp. GY 10127]
MAAVGLVLGVAALVAAVGWQVGAVAPEETRDGRALRLAARCWLPLTLAFACAMALRLVVR